jgi:hypothetical protein
MLSFWNREPLPGREFATGSASQGALVKFAGKWRLAGFRHCEARRKELTSNPRLDQVTNARPRQKSCLCFRLADVASNREFAKAHFRRVLAGHGTSGSSRVRTEATSPAASLLSAQDVADPAGESGFADFAAYSSRSGFGDVSYGQCCSGRREPPSQ